MAAIENSNPGIKALFHDRRLISLSSLAAVGRWQESMAILAVMLGTISAGFSLTQASLATGLLTVVVALSATIKGRLQDRLGARQMVGLLSLLTALSYALLVAALLSGLFAAVLVAAVLIGASRTNPGMYMQVTWLEVLRDEKLRAKAVSWENLMATLTQNTGPILVSGLIAILSPMAALIFCGLITSTSMFLWSRSSVHKEHVIKAKGCRLGSKLGFKVVALVGTVMFISILVGALRVILVGSSSASMAAIMTAVLAAGAGAASIYSIIRQFPLLNNLRVALIAGLVAMTALVVIASQLGAWLTIPALFIGGIIYGLSNSASPLFLQRSVVKERRIEAFSWRVTLNFLGLGLGQLIAGLLVPAIGITGAGLVLGGLGLIFSLVATAILFHGVRFSWRPTVATQLKPA